MLVRVKNKSLFLARVFGAESILDSFPDIETTGITVEKRGEFHYISESGKLVHDSAFFSEDEMAYLEEIKDHPISAHGANPKGRWKFRIWDYDNWLTRVLEGSSKEAVVTEFCRNHSWLESRKQEIVNSMIDY